MFQHNHPKCKIIMMRRFDLKNIHRPQNTIWEIEVDIWEGGREKLTFYTFVKLLLRSYIIQWNIY